MKFSGVAAAIILVFVGASIVQAQVNGAVRIVNGTNTTSLVGRVEIYSGGSWRTVCGDSGFCENAAKVVCRQLGYDTFDAQAYGMALYGSGSGSVGFQDFSCTGSETNVSQCTYTSPSTCSSSMAAAVSCRPYTACYALGHTGCCSGGGCLSFSPFCWCDSTCHDYGDCCPGIEYTCPAGGGPPMYVVPGSGRCTTIGDVSFIGGQGSAGRVTICDTDYRWKTVCDSGFDANEATVICRSLGLSTSNFTIYNSTQYGQGTERIYSKDLSCTAAINETVLTDCSGADTCCGHQRDVGLACQPACSPGQVRFVGGPTNMEGRVEVCNEGRWGTVCDDLWDIKDARVACKQAGLPWKGAVAYSYPVAYNTYGSGVGPIWFDNLACDGSEGSLFNCTANAVGSHNCIHLEDAGAKCAPGPCDLAGYGDRCCDPSVDGNCQGVTNETVCHCSLDCEDHNDCCIDFSLGCRCNNYDVRLREGQVPNEGRVEICYNGEWGTVCDDFWNNPDAQVVCRQLGYSPIGATALSFAYFGRGSGQIWLDNVFCSGTETHLINCSANALGSHNCGHYEDASVRCVIPGAPECTHGQARLVRGPSDREGQLEVCYNGKWGTVCDDFFGQVDANVACRTIFPSDPSGNALFIQYSYQYFGYSTRDIVMDNVQCTGSETNIINCTHITNHNCYHYEDVGLGCYLPATYYGQPTLSPGPEAGQLKVYTNSWGYVCWSGFGVEDARVVCRELGQPTASPRVYLNRQFGRGLGSAKYTQVACTGNETHLNNCTKQSSGFYCSSYWAVGVGCEEACVHGQMKLVGGVNSTEGRVEICRNGTWGTICDPPGASTWGTEEAVVVCKQLGLPYTAAQVKSFGPGADPYNYASVDCEGTEANLAGCSFDPTPSCSSHYYDVGVTCQEVCNSGEVRLVDGGSDNQGRLEICIGGLWGTVCDEEFHNVDAQVVCKQLGLPYAGAEATYDASFGQGTDHIAITSLYCTGSETNLLSCIFQTGSSVTCNHANDAGVICQDVCQNGALRLAGGNAPNTGRIETCYHAEWGTICDNGWGYPDVQVACYQLGYEKSPVRAFGGSKFGPGVGDIIFRDMGCSGMETALTQCTSNTNTDGCTHSDDAGMECAGSVRPVTATATPTTTPAPLPPPSPVTNVGFTIVNTTFVMVNWSAPAQPNGVIIAYVVSVGGMTMTIAGNQPRQAYFNTLASGVPYTMSIIATNVHGASDAWTKMFFTAELTPDTPVPIVQSSRDDEYTISITWAPLNMIQARGTVINYYVNWVVFQEGTIPTPMSVMLGADSSSWTSPSTLAPSSRYSISVAAATRIGIGPYTSPATIIPTTSTSFFQLKIALPAGQQCGTWTGTATSTKLTSIANAVIIEVNKACIGCRYTSQHIANMRFQCNSDDSESDQATFRGQLFAPGNVPNITILGYVNSWLNSTTTPPTVTIDGVNFNVDSSCMLSIRSFDDTLCTTARTGTSSGAIGSSVGIGLGVGIGAIVVFAIMIVVLVFIVVFVRRTRIKYSAGDNNDVVGYSNRMAFPEGGDDNISQHMGSTVHDDDFQEALNMISDDIDDKAKLAAQEQGQVYMNIN